MDQLTARDRTGARLITFGIVLFLAGLITGFVIPLMENPRVGLSSHLEGVLNGTFLIALGAVWPRLALRGWLATLAAWLLLFGATANWLATLLAAVWGTGIMMPIAAAGRAGSALQENLVAGLLVTLSLAMVAACVILVWGASRAATRD